MLLTQSQVSVAVSSGVVIVFTFLLFVSGLVIQQRSVVSLQEALKPRIPKPPSTIAVSQQLPLQPDLRPSRFFGSKSDQGDAYTEFKRIQELSANVNWKKLAHVQLARSHRDVCNAIMVLAEFHRLKSPARRVLLFPEEWAMEKQAEKGDVSDPYLDISRRLMRMAARRYGVELRPVSPLVKTEAAEGGTNSSYSLASTFALTEFDRVLSLDTPGLLMDASPLDAMLAFQEPTPFAMLHGTPEKDGVHSSDLFLIQPSEQIHQRVTKLATSTPSFNDTLLPHAFEDIALLASSSESSALVRSIGTLHAAPPSFNRTAFVTDVAYLRFSDPKLPGPQYDVTWSDKVAARPQNKDADWAWTQLYGQFAQKRMEICGLDLEIWRP